MTDQNKKPFSDKRWHDDMQGVKFHSPDPDFKLSEEQKENLKSWNEFVEQVKKDAEQS